MNKEEYIKKNFDITDDTIRLIKNAEEKLKPQFDYAQSIAELNQFKIMKAFSDNRVSSSHFASTTGYGHDDLGRDTLDKVYAQVFDAEDGLVRHNFISGTHTISSALFAISRPGDMLLSITGKPYDSLGEVLGIEGEPGSGSLRDYGVKYAEIPLKSDGMPDREKIADFLNKNKVKAVLMQRSKGYADRPTYSAKQLGDLISFVKGICPDIICFVDNCYGEFVCEDEPTTFGADVMAGSLIKNPGGGLAPTGGYIVGKSKYIELCVNSLTAVGLGRDAGASLGVNRLFYQGLFMAPHTVLQALKSAMLCSAVFESLGFEVNPLPNEKRFDIIQSIKFNDPEKMKAFCRGIQKGAPIDNFVIPEPWDMPGYPDKVIMAAGGFIQGASIELSADGPMRSPYIAYMQGGLTYESAKLGIMVAAQFCKSH